MVNSEFNYTDQRPEVIEVIEKYRSAETLNEEEKREILSVLEEEKAISLNDEEPGFNLKQGYVVSSAFINILTSLSELQLLDLSYAEVDILPGDIGNLSSLQFLSLRGTGIWELPESIGSLEDLQFLELQETSIGQLPENIGGLENLQYLELQETPIRQLPESIGNLRSLRFLSLSGTQIRELPERIGSLQNLQELDLEESKIRKLPESIGSLNYLQGLNLSSTQIRELPESIGRLQNLQELELNSTQIRELPESIGSLNSIHGLYLNSTQIRELPESIGRLQNLQELDLNASQIRKLPENIGDLRRLRNLTLRKTRITELPESIGELASLEWLDLRLTKITELPESTGKLSSLKTLYLSGSQIRKLPESIGKIQTLKKLVLEDIELPDLPESLLSLNLPFVNEEVSFYGLPGIYICNLKLKNQPIEIFRQSRELIVEYYKSNRASRPINECKIVFLGDGGAGKTLMIDRLMRDGESSPDFKGDATPGIYIQSKKYRIKEDEIELHFWDFGGQAIMHSMHRLFLTSRTLYVVVANARDNKANEQAWYWIRNIKSFANGAPVLLLVNQKDQNPSANVNQTGLKKEYEHLMAVGIVSALKSSREEFNAEIRDVICGIVAEMDTVRTPFARPWLSLMNDLQGMSDDYITSDAFYEKCRGNGVGTEKMILDEIISWYQDLGVCFYSRKHPVTSQYMVLKPRWLLNALYILIFNGRKYAVNGIIREKDIYELICEPVPDENVKKVWSDIEYHPNEIQYIINVLLNFGLIYRLDQEHFFLPMLCDENESEALSRFESEDATHISFEYVYLPENVLHCLMVRHGYELNTDIVWRTGAVFERKSCGWSALVRIRDNCLDVYVKADDAQKHPVNSYLDMIRESVYRINDSLGLNADEFIAYRRDSKEDRFEYQILTGSKEAGLDKVYSAVFKRAIEIDEILGILENLKGLKDQLIKNVMEQMLSVLTEMSERCVYLADRDEVELTADYHNAIAPVLNAKFKIQTAREYTMGRSKKKIGETDLYFFRYQDGIKEELYILENKKIRDFTAQYRQLMGYLNPDFSAGITLSINTDKGWEEAFDYIYGLLEKLRDEKGEFAPVLIDRITASKRTQYIRTEHIVPETGLTMPVYHLVLQLSDEARQRIAIAARR